MAAIVGIATIAAIMFAIGVFVGRSEPVAAPSAEPLTASGPIGPWQRYGHGSVQFAHLKAQWPQCALKPDGPRHRPRTAKPRRIRHGHLRSVVTQPAAGGGHHPRRGARQRPAHEQIGLHKHLGSHLERAGLRNAGCVQHFSHQLIKRAAVVTFATGKSHGHGMG